jgi:DNA-directed RNA polymerase specialized sigma24 family protein
VEPWAVRLLAGDPDAAWDLFVGRYRRLIFAAIRHYTTDHDEVMDVFAQACQALRADDLARLRRYLEQPNHSARLSTWLVTVVRNLTVDWFRHRDGRPRIGALATELPLLQRSIFEHVFLRGHSHLETFELLRTSDHPALSFKEFQNELRATYRAVAAKRRGPLIGELAGPWPMSDDGEVDPGPTGPRELGPLLERALVTLPTAERTAVRLYVVQEMPADQVARVVGWPNAKAVYNRVYRALAELRGHLDRAGIRRGDM